MDTEEHAQNKEIGEQPGHEVMPSPAEPESPEELRLLDEREAGKWDEAQYFERLFALKKAEEEKRHAAVKKALGKFNVFLHLTAYLSGLAYLIILGILMPRTLPYVFIPVGLWTLALGYHFYRAFRQP
ncbi:MAG: hypothetical protein CVT63_05290 [Candidatus Anoxymicrobium japonicum]|uniref:2TM domain-containing protein n=1 Tax=Candidatus Anoxymicrobium japonicum TaxID=2013648 RepID=A0A2N3G5F5_9ACTN|nr:MAG: hypothetical protein CVT63_05290 [Candidatus Anoxymicrobium japonicum]